MLLQGIALALLLAAQATVPPGIPDPTKGSVDGKQGMMQIPSLIEKPDTPIDPQGCEVHLVPVDNLDTELVYPCSTWYAPPPGSYHLWLETETRITPFPFGIRYGGAQFTGRGMIAVTPVAPAGWLRVDSSSVRSEARSVRFVGVDAHLRHAVALRSPLQRRTNAGDRHPVRMPAGRTIVGAFDENDDAIALSPPVSVDEGRIVDVSLTRPATGSDLLVVMRRPRVPTKERPDEVGFTLVGTAGEEPIAPDVTINGARLVFAVWYGIPHERARVQVVSEALFHEPIEATLREKRVTTVRSSLRQKPALDVSTYAPPSRLDSEEWTLGIGAGDHVVRQLTIEPRSTVRVESLPAAPLVVTLEAGPWRFSRSADLSHGQDGVVDFTLEPILVSGRVTRGRDPVGAEIRFSTRSDVYETVETGEQGEYEVLLWRTGLYPVLVNARDSPDTPFFEFVDVAGTRTVDFELPDATATVRVVDQRTGQPLPGATVVFGNIWEDPDSGKRRTGQRAEADSDGIAVSPPLRHGRLEINVSAPGYRTSEPLERVIDADSRLDIRVSLAPFEDGTICRVLLPDGSAAAGAELMSLVSGDDDRPFWQGTADGRGEVTIPGDLEHRDLLVRHPAAASTIRRWEPRGSEETVALGIAAHPLAIRVRLANGSTVRHAEPSLWIDGRRVSGPALGFLTWSRFRTDSAGSWNGRGLACAQLRLLVPARPDLRPRIDAGQFDALATTVTCPWPELVPIIAVE